MTKKHPQFILAADAGFFNNTNFPKPVTLYSLKKLAQDIQPCVVIRERHGLETDPLHRQILPYLILRKKDDSGLIRYVTYRRGSGVGEARLAGNVSIGFGGHIDALDVSFSDSSVFDLMDTIIYASLRELGEEVHAVLQGDIVLTEDDKDAMFIQAAATHDETYILLDNSNDVGSVHVGIVFVFDIPDNVVISSAEEELEELKLLTLDELLDGDLPLENWTQMYLQEIRAA